MNTQEEKMNAQELVLILKQDLPNSTTQDRKDWVSQIIEHKINLNELSELLFSESKITSRFMWLLTDLGELNPNVLHEFLPYLMKVRDRINYKEIGASFANYWLVSGVPQENESEAIDLLFSWVQSGDSKVTTKSRSIFVLYNLTKKYPELKNELRIVLKDQMDGSSEGFAKRATKLLSKLEG